MNADAQFVLITPTTLCRAEMRVVLLPPKDASGSDQECQIDFVFNYICAFPLCCGKFYQQACALSDHPTAMAQHACRICSPCTCHCAQSDAVPTSVYSSASFLLICIVAEISLDLFALLDSATWELPPLNNGDALNDYLNK